MFSSEVLAGSVVKGVISLLPGAAMALLAQKAKMTVATDAFMIASMNERFQTMDEMMKWCCVGLDKSLTPAGK